MRLIIYLWMAEERAYYTRLILEEIKRIQKERALARRLGENVCE